jgi:hypothetical protein
MFQFNECNFISFSPSFLDSRLVVLTVLIEERGDNCRINWNMQILFRP